MKTNRLSKFFAASLAVTSVFFTGLTDADAAAVRLNPGFAASSLAANDDGSTGLVPLGFSIDFYGITGISSVYINNNGNVTFDAPRGAFTPDTLLAGATSTIAPFFADVDTRAGALMTYGTDTVGGHAAFGVNWIDVGYFSGHTDPTNSFQLVIIDRSDVAPGDFDFEFNYDRILWETGDFSGGSGGLGGTAARAGWTDGISEYLELPGSGTAGGLLDGNPAGLIHDSINSTELGRYSFRVRGGVVTPTPDAGSTVAMLGLALVGLAGFKKKMAGKKA